MLSAREFYSGLHRFLQVATLLRGGGAECYSQPSSLNHKLFILTQKARKSQSMLVVLAWASGWLIYQPQMTRITQRARRCARACRLRRAFSKPSSLNHQQLFSHRKHRTFRSLAGGKSKTQKTLVTLALPPDDYFILNWTMTKTKTGSGTAVALHQASTDDSKSFFIRRIVCKRFGNSFFTTLKTTSASKSK